jgi:hypothetical protein
MLVCFGDSWPAGAELAPHEKTFGAIIAENLGVPFLNYCRRSTSISHLVLQLRSFLDENPQRTPTQAIFFLTSPVRDLAWKDDQWYELNPSEAADYNQTYFKKYHSKQLEWYRTNVTVTSLMYLCATHDIKDLYVWGWETIDLWPDIPRYKFWQQGEKTVLDMFDDRGTKTLIEYKNDPNNLYIAPKKSHPNQRGHQLIAQRLSEWLQDVHKI